MSSTPGRTLADQVRAWPDARLSALLEARPDLTTPAPNDSAQLAARAATKSSVWRVLDRLNHFELATLEAVANHSPESVHAGDTAPVLQRLSDLMLIWDDGNGVRPVTAVAELFSVPPGPAEAEIPALLESVDPKARAILDHLEETGADGTVDLIPARLTVQTARTPTEELLARKLLVARDHRKVTIPWSVRVFLRDGHATRDPVDAEPTMSLNAVTPALVDRMSTGAAFEFTRRVELLLDHWGTHPPAMLKAGGVSVRDLKATAELLQVSTSEAGLIIEVAHAAGLVGHGMTDESDAVWVPTDAFDVWQAAATAERWVRLASAWLESARLMFKVGGRIADKPVNALSEGLERSWMAAARRDVLGELSHDAGLAAGTGLPSLLERLRWLRPRRPRGHGEAVEAILTEAAFLGLTARGAIASYAATLLTGGDAAGALAPLLPDPVDHVLLQADLTAIAPGPLESELSRQLALVADVESRGGATVFRFTDSSVRRAFDAGWSAVEVHEFVASASKTPVPQGLSYLVDDVSRRFGVLRAGTAESFLRSDDEAALSELIHLGSALRLRRIAPTVVVSDVPLAQLLPKVRDLGFAPVVEAIDGTVRVARADVYRARSPRIRSAAPELARQGARVAAVTAAIRAGDRVAASRPRRRQATSTVEVMDLLRAAALDSASVLIGYVGNDGTVGERLVRPDSVEGGRLTAYDERSEDTREFAIHRITAASLTT